MTDPSAPLPELSDSGLLPSLRLEPKTNARRIATRRVAGPVGLGLLGTGAICLLIRTVDWNAFKTTLCTSIVWMPVLIALEGARLVTEAFGTLWSCGSRGTVPPTRLLTAQLIGTAAGSVTPAGRIAAEAVKATLLTPWLGGACAAAGATTSQAASLLATALISVPCTVCAFVETGASTVTFALLMHTLVAGGQGAGIRLGTRARKVLGWLRRRLARLGRSTYGFERSIHSQSFVPSRPLAMMFLGRSLQTAQYAVLAIAVSGSTTCTRAFLVQGVNLIGLAVGALVPAQLGLIDGAFAMSADAIGVTAAQALSISVMSHMIQAFYVIAGLAACLWWRIPSKTAG